MRPYDMKATRNGLRRRGEQVLVLAGVLLGGVGCSENRGPGTTLGREAGWSQATLPGVSEPAAREAGVYAMRQWFRLDPAAPADGVIQGLPEEYEQRGGTGRIRDEAVGYRNRLRRTATLVIQETPTGCVAKCRVQVERLDTADHRVFSSNEQFGDVPNETPIDREAGVTPRQQQVWTTLPRDRDLERRILNVLRDELAQGGPASQPTPG